MTATAAVQTARTLTLPAETLKALPVLKKAINIHSRIPILQNALIRYDGHTFEISTTDLETWASHVARIEGSNAYEFITTIPFGMFFEHVRGAKQVSIEDYSDGDKITVVADGSRRVFYTLPADEFPVNLGQATGPVKAVFEVPVAEFQTAAVRAYSAAAAEEARGAVLMGVLLEVGKDKYKLTGTDGFRLSHTKGRTLFADGKDSAIMPRTFLETVNAIKVGKGPLNGRITVSNVNGAKWALFYTGTGYDIRGRCVDGQYPNYRMVIPAVDKNDPHIVVERKPLITLVKQAEKAAGDRASSVRVRLSEDSSALELHAHSDTAGTFDGSIPVTDRHVMFAPTAFNGVYLAECLSRLDAEKVRLVQPGPLSPMHIYNGEGITDTFYLLMPLRAD